MNRMKILLIIICFFSFIGTSFSQSRKDFKPFLLIGKIIGKDSGSIAISYNQAETDLLEGYKNKTVINDSAEIKNGVFYFEGNILEPTVAVINSERFHYITSFYIEPGVMKVTFNTKNFKEFELTGSKTHKDLQEWGLFTKPIGDEKDLLTRQLIRLDSVYRKTRDENIAKKCINISERIDSLRSQLYDLNIGFMRAHPKSVITKRLLEYSLTTNELSLESLKSLYKGLDKTIRNSKNGQRVRKEILQREKSAVGVKAPDFTTLDINNQSFSLSDFRGKNEILLVFWSSGNSFSRKSFPHLNAVYTKYHPKGLEIIGVASEVLKDRWRKSVEHDSIYYWRHVLSSGEYFSNLNTIDNILEKYSVQGYSYDLKILPVEVLINKKGKIIGRWQGDMESLDKKLAEFYN